jgi:hypothetical protein
MTSNHTSNQTTIAGSLDGSSGHHRAAKSTVLLDGHSHKTKRNNEILGMILTKPHPILVNS